MVSREESLEILERIASDLWRLLEDAETFFNGVDPTPRKTNHQKEVSRFIGLANLVGARPLLRSSKFFVEAIRKQGIRNDDAPKLRAYVIARIGDRLKGAWGFAGEADKSIQIALLLGYDIALEVRDTLHVVPNLCNRPGDESRIPNRSYETRTLSVNRGCLKFANTDRNRECLYEYFLMSLQKVDVRRIRLCRDQRCGGFFWASDIRQRYCNSRCSNRASQRRHYNLRKRIATSQPGVPL